MISKNTIKLINSLSIKKFRQKERLFIVEGDKNVAEVLTSMYKVKWLFATEDYLAKHKNKIDSHTKLEEVQPDEIKKASLLKTPQSCIAICQIPSPDEFPEQIQDNLSLYLDGIQDPGNLGTIIRICDWFGIENLYCSPDTADLYNPKVIQASMGSFCRVKVWYISFNEIQQTAVQSDVIITGAFLNGKNIFTEQIPAKVLLVIGNEGKGIRKEIEKKIDKKIMIPSFAKMNSGAESLNAGVATGILCAEIRRQQS